MATNQLERIRAMEQRLDTIAEATTTLSEALDRYIAVQTDIEQLDAYYGSEEWRGDLADDTAGKLPHDLKRGVLSEDAVWNALAEVRELNRQIEEFAETVPRKLHH